MGVHIAEEAGSAHVKWLSYYDRDFTPWDSHAVCSQLAAGLTFDFASMLARKDRTQHSSTQNTAPEANTDGEGDGDKPFPSATGPGPSIEKMLEDMDQEIAALESQLSESTSKIEKLESMIKIACRKMAGTVYERFRSQRKPELASAMQHAKQMSEEETTAFEESCSDVHESIRNMYSQQIRERLLATQETLAEVLTVRQAEILQRYGQRRTAWEERKTAEARVQLGPHLVIGSHSGPAEWQCLELGCGTGATAVWLAAQGSRVVGVDVCSKPLRTARARAIAERVVSRCVFLQGDLFDLAYSAGASDARERAGVGRAILSCPLAEAAQMQYKAGGIAARPLFAPPGVGSGGGTRAGEGEGGGGGEGNKGSEGAAEEEDEPQGGNVDLTRSLLLQSVLEFGHDGPPQSPSHGRARGTGREGMLVGGSEATVQGGAFDLIVDVQCFHVLRTVDLARFVGVVRQNLRCGGLYFVMTGNDREPEVGPSVLSKRQLLTPFEPFCDVEAVFETRFDATEHYDTLSQPPLAWCALLRRRVELDASQWQSITDGWVALLAAIGSAANHLHSVDALVDSLLGDHNAVRRPITIRILFPPQDGRGSEAGGGHASAVRGWAQRLCGVFDQLHHDGAFADLRRARFLVE